MKYYIVQNIKEELELINEYLFGDGINSQETSLNRDDDAIEASKSDERKKKIVKDLKKLKK